MFKSNFWDETKYQKIKIIRYNFVKNRCNLIDIIISTYLFVTFLIILGVVGVMRSPGPLELGKVQKFTNFILADLYQAETQIISCLTIYYQRKRETELLKQEYDI